MQFSSYIFYFYTYFLFLYVLLIFLSYVINSILSKHPTVIFLRGYLLLLFLPHLLLLSLVILLLYFFCLYSSSSSSSSCIFIFLSLLVFLLLPFLFKLQVSIHLVPQSDSSRHINTRRICLYRYRHIETNT